MMLLDTDVVSEIMRPRPDAVIANWIAQLPLAETALAATTVAELLYGIAVMPAGARRDDRANRLAQFIERLTVLPFDMKAARFSAEIGAARKTAGRPISAFDCQIAATARVIGATVATRDVGGFLDCGVDCINPWDL